MRVILAIGLAAILVAGAAAQQHPNGYAGTSTTGRLFLFSGPGMASTFTVGTSTGHGLVMGPQNRLLYAANLDGTIYQVDPTNGTVVTSNPGVASQYEIAIDGNGEVFVTTSTSLFKIDQSNTVTTVITGQASLYGGMTIDPTTGDILVQSASGTDPVFRVARDGSSVTTVGSGMDARYGMDIHIPSNSIFSGSCCGDFTPSENIFQLDIGTATASTWLASAAPPVGVYSLKSDRSSAAAQRLVLGAFAPSSTARGPGGIYHVDVATKAVTTFATLPAGASLYETEILYRRNVHSVRTGTGTWAVGVKIPEDAGRTYVLAVSASGIRPGLGFPGGRTGYLAVDTVTIIGLTAGLAPFLTGTVGTLSAAGEANAKLDLSSIGSPANGVRLFFLAITLDQAAPGGIQTITDPHVLQVEGL